MGIDLVSSIKQLKIPHKKEEHIEIRVGIHTGMYIYIMLEYCFHAKHKQILYQKTLSLYFFYEIFTGFNKLKMMSEGAYDNLKNVKTINMFHNCYLKEETVALTKPLKTISYDSRFQSDIVQGKNDFWLHCALQGRIMKVVECMFHYCINIVFKLRFHSYATKFYLNIKKNQYGWVSECLLTPSGNYSAISWREQVTFWWDYVRLVKTRW